MNACDFVPGAKFHIDGNGDIVYTYESVLVGLDPSQKHCRIKTNLNDQCNAVVFRDHLLMYKFVGFVQLQTRIQFNQLTLIPTN